MADYVFNQSTYLGMKQNQMVDISVSYTSLKRDARNTTYFIDNYFTDNPFLKKKIKTLFPAADEIGHNLL